MIKSEERKKGFTDITALRWVERNAGSQGSRNVIHEKLQKKLTNNAAGDCVQLT
jgi:hypothetical protein